MLHPRVVLYPYRALEMAKIGLSLLWGLIMWAALIVILVVGSQIEKWLS